MLINTRKDIETNRLTLGFLNYERLKNLYKEPEEIKDNENIE